MPIDAGRMSKNIGTPTAWEPASGQPNYYEEMSDGDDWHDPFVRVQVTVADPGGTKTAFVLLDVTVGFSDQ